MNAHAPSALLAAVLVLGACSAPRASAQAPAPRTDFGLPAPRAALVFPPDARQVTPAWLADELARLTGQELLLSPDLRLQLERHAEPLESTRPVPADEVYAFVEGMLSQQALVLAPLKGGDRPVLALYPAQAAAAAVPVEASIEQLELVARHPLLLFQLVLTLENVDARQLQTQLRPLTADASGTLQVLTCGDRSLLLQGPGMRLAGLARMLLEVDRASAARDKPAVVAPAPAAR